MQALLFDIDGTLIHTAGSGKAALQIAFAEVFDRPLPEEIDMVGRTDRGILADLFRRHGIEDTLVNWERWCTAYVRHLVEELPLRAGRILPGVVSLLEQLARRGDTALGLLTGNASQGARIKLEHFGLGHHFRFGGFGDWQPERNGVAAEALAAARRFVGQDLPAARVWVIGDTPLDVQCARHIGAHAVAVSSGFAPRAELARAQPDLLLSSLEEADQLLAQL
jgi:phosphoglycolate phosphatase-like HAD superfamily hydrolase